MQKAIVLFTKAPEVGRVKSRLVKSAGLTAEDACQLYSAILADVFDLLRQVAESTGSELYVAYTPVGQREKVRQLFGNASSRALFLPQEGATTGERITRAFEEVFRRGNDVALVVFGDQPELSVETLRGALETVEGAAQRGEDAVILGPTCDGGTYLIGSTRTSTEWLRGSIDCSNTSKAVSKLILRARAAKIPLVLLRESVDVDDLADLTLLKKQSLREYPTTSDILNSIGTSVNLKNSERISVIIPTLNEEKTLSRTILSIRNQNYPSAEIIVVDSGSHDGTLEIANCMADRVVVVNRKSRQHQENVGAKGAKGGILLFLHADTLLRPSFLKSVVSQMADPTIVGGGARLEYQPVRLRYLAMCAFRDLVSRTLKIHGMGSSFFVRRQALFDMGWFDEEMNEEGVDMSKRLRARGRFVLLDEVVQTSARRYEKLGFAKTLLAWALTVTLSYLGLRGVSIEERIWRPVR